MAEELDSDALTQAHLAVENELIEWRDARRSMLGCANGFVVRERDGSESSIIRLGTRDGLRIGINAYLEALRQAIPTHNGEPALCCDWYDGNECTMPPNHSGDHSCEVDAGTITWSDPLDHDPSEEE